MQARRGDPSPPSRHRAMLAHCSCPPGNGGMARSQGQMRVACWTHPTRETPASKKERTASTHLDPTLKPPLGWRPSEPSSGSSNPPSSTTTLGLELEEAPERAPSSG